MTQIPDAIIHALGIVVDQTYFFRRIQLRQRAHSLPDEKSKILVFFAAHVSIEKWRMRRIVESRHQVRIDVVHGFALQQILSEAKRTLTALPHPFAPMCEGNARLGGHCRIFTKAGGKLLPAILSETKNNLGKIFFALSGASTAFELSRIDCENGL